MKRFILIIVACILSGCLDENPRSNSEHRSSSHSSVKQSSDSMQNIEDENLKLSENLIESDLLSNPSFELPRDWPFEDILMPIYSSPVACEIIGSIAKSEAATLASVKADSSTDWLDIYGVAFRSHYDFELLFSYFSQIQPIEELSIIPRGNNEMPSNEFPYVNWTGGDPFTSIIFSECSCSSNSKHYRFVIYVESPKLK